MLGLPRSTVYYNPRPVSAEALKLMRRSTNCVLIIPLRARGCCAICCGARASSSAAGVATLMKRMEIEALYRRPNTSKSSPGQKIYPYLLRGVMIERPNHVWAMDISYIPMRRGFVYLAAVVDVASRRVLAHRVSITPFPARRPAPQ